MDNRMDKSSCRKKVKHSGHLNNYCDCPKMVVVIMQKNAPKDADGMTNSIDLIRLHCLLRSVSILTILRQ